MGTDWGHCKSDISMGGCYRPELFLLDGSTFACVPVSDEYLAYKPG